MKAQSLVNRPVWNGARLLALSGALLLSTACAKDNAKPNHLDVAEAPKVSNDDWIQQQRRLSIKYYDSSGVLIGETENGGVNDVYSAAVNYCYSVYGGSYGTGNDCWDTQYRPEIAQNICIARTFLAIATVQSEPVKLVYSTGPSNPNQSVIVDKVKEANSAELAAYSQEYARYATDRALSFLRMPPAVCRTAGASGVWTTAPTDNRNMALVIAGAAADAYYLVRAGYDKALESTLNVADAARSSTPSLPDQWGRSLLGSAFSRAAAAHLLVGGDVGLLGSTTKGYCLNPSLTPQARQALELLRDAAPSPAAIVGTGDIQSLLYTSSADGSVRQRLGQFYGISALGAGLASGAQVETYYGLDEKDFVQARDYLRQEIDVFGRSITAKYAPIGSYSRYAGSGGDRVKELPEGAWSARARYSAAPNIFYAGNGVWPIAPNGQYPNYSYQNVFPPLNTFIGQVHAQIRDLARFSTDHFGTTSGTLPTPSSKEVLGLLGSIIGSNEYKGALEMAATATKLVAFAHGYAAADKVRVVVGEDGLRCAVEGTIEGADCSDALSGAQYNNPTPAACTAKPASLNCLTALVISGDTTGSSGFGTTNYTGTSAGRTFDPSQIFANKTRVYVVKLKSQSLGEQPGNYELLAGTTLYVNSNLAIPVVVGIDSRVAKILAPNRRNCAQQAVTCVGKSLDERMPLENELTDNGDAVENSWRHYLDLARQAANESDALGKEFENAKLTRLQNEALAAQRVEEQKQAAAAAIDEVQALCGTQLDTRKLLESFSGGPGKVTLSDTISYSVACPSCDSTSQCVAGKCYRTFTSLSSDPNFKNEPDAARFALCLDDTPAAVNPFVTLGDKDVCVYSSTAWPFDVCPKSKLGNQSCPTTKDGSCPAAPAGTKVDVAKPLSYYKNSVPPDLNGCQLLRKTRQSHLAVDLAKLITTQAFHPNSINDRVGKLSYVSGYGGHFTILEDGGPRWSSGSITDGRVTAAWPAVSTCGAGEAGLFCSTAGTTNAQIGAFNLRVLKAALAAAAIRSYTAAGQTEPKKGLDLVYPFAPNYTFNDPPEWKTTCQDWDGIAMGVPPLSKVIRTTGYKIGTNTPFTFCENSTSFLKGYGYDWPGGNPTEVAWIYPNGTTATGNFEFRGPRTWLTTKDNAEGFMVKAKSPSTMTAQLFSRMFDGQVAGTGTSLVAFGLLNTRPESTALWDILPDDVSSLGYFGSPTELDIGNTLDGMELLCELAARHGGASTKPSSLTTLSDVEQAGAYLEGLAQQITDRAALTIFANVPALATDALGDTPPTGAFPALSGQMGEAVASLRSALDATKNALPVVSTSLQQMGAEMQSLRSSLDMADTEKEIISLETLSMTLNQVNGCAQAVASLSFGSPLECLNAAAQIAIGLKKSVLEKEVADDKAAISRAAFADRMASLSLAMQQAALGLQQATDEVGGALARIDGLRKQARVAISKALYLNSYHSEKQVLYDQAVGALSDLAQTRYVSALKNAKLMSFYAKRAIEQRLGMPLAEMTEDLPLVTSPQSWEANLCTMGGIQGDRSTQGKDWVQVYGEGFIGDYVDRLQAVVESYNLVNNFHEGKDVAVISLRDDVLGVREVCSVPSTNLLNSSVELTDSAWQPRNCVSKVYNTVTYSSLNCMAAVPSALSSGPDLAVQGQFGSQDAAPGFILRFSDGKATCSNATGPCGWQSGSALSQLVTLEPGRYRFSWYTRDVVSANVNGAKQGIAMIRVPGAASAFGNSDGNTTGFINSFDAGGSSPFVFPTLGSVAGDRWKRASVEFRIQSRGQYEVGFGLTAATPPSYEVTVAAPMLQMVKNDGSNSLLPAFQGTDANGKMVARACEDTDGSVFRAKSWHRDCVHLCDAGFEGNCSTGPLSCYQEMSFGVSQSWIQSGRLFNYSGFAKGNFNYRIDNLGLNFVGSGIRNCKDSKLPSTCYNAGFVPYSIRHAGPFFVRNQSGADYRAPLFDGNIEHARGLGLERYLTNPISSTDRELLTDYWRSEFAGRPLDGTFKVRVWEEPGVDFNAIQDVQLILNYRYWTAFN